VTESDEWKSWKPFADQLGVSRANPKDWKPVEKGTRAYSARQNKLLTMLENRLAMGPLDAVLDVLELIDMSHPRAPTGLTYALSIAAQWNRLDALPHLLEKGTHPNAEIFPPLGTAMGEGHVAFARALLEAGARWEDAFEGPLQDAVPKESYEAFVTLEEEFKGKLPPVPRRLGNPHYIELYAVSLMTEALDALTRKSGAKKPFSSFCTDAECDSRDKRRSPRTVLPMVRSYIRYLDQHPDALEDARDDFGRPPQDLEAVVGDLRLSEADAELALEQGVKVVLAITR